MTYTGSHRFHLFRSRDINAPRPLLFQSRPDPAVGVLRQIESTGQQQSDSLSVTIRGRMTKWFNGQAQYTLARAYNDTNGINWCPDNDYDLSGEYARADFDRLHRLVLLGRLAPRKIADTGVSLTMNSAGPYTELLGADVYNNARGRARPPGVTRNTLEAAGYASLDLRVARDIALGPGKSERELTIGADVFNLTNQVNYGSYVGTIGSPLFLQPTSARPARQVQLSARFKF